MDDVPREIFKQILTFCSLASRVSLSLCCKDFYSNVDLLNDPLYRKVKSFSKDITNSDLHEILDVDSKQIDRQNVKYILKLVDKSHHWDIVFYLTLQYNDMTMDDFCKTDQNIAHITGKIFKVFLEKLALG